MKHFSIIITLTALWSILALANIVYVPQDQPTIQSGINAAVNGDTVLVADSLYYENINFKGKAITVASHFLMDSNTVHIDNTIIDGSQPSYPDTGSVVRFISGEDTTSVLMGFTITNGTGTKLISTGSGNNFPLRAGGGILCWNSGGRFIHNKIINTTLNDSTLAFGGGFSAGDIGSNEWVILEKNQIENNMVNSAAVAYAGYGGGIGLTCNGKIINNTISNNSCTATNGAAVGGGIRGSNEVQEQRTLFIEDNTITSNFTKGTGVAAQNYFAALGSGINLYGRFKASILGNEISDNQLQSFNNGHGSGGGIWMYLCESGSVISGNIISDNKNEVTGTKYGGGIGLFQFNGLSITNNIIIRNSGSHGAGISLSYNNAEIINNTIINNTASTNGGGLYVENSQPLVSNSILWNNQAVNGAGIYPSFLTNVRYSDVQGGYTGPGNINADPLFADTIQFCLLDASPCIGAGITPCPPYDIYSNSRPDPPGSMPDIGACESPLDTACTPGFLGDINIDDNVNSTDGLILLSYDAGLSIPPQYLERINIGFGDADEGGTTNSTDALIILSYDAGITVPFPVGDPVCLPGSSSRSQGLTKAIPNAGESIRISAVPTSKQITQGMTIDIPVIVDMNQISEKLGSYTAALEWNPEVFEFVSQSGGTTEGFENPIVNDKEIEKGKLKFAHAYPFGADKEVNLLNVQLKVIAEEGSTNSISLNFSAMAAAKTFVDLLPYLKPDDKVMDIEAGDIPNTYSVVQYPNPFNPTTTFEFALPQSGFVTLKIYNVLGEEVATLVSKKLAAGSYKYDWDASRLASGVYLYRIVAGDYVQFKKMILLK